MTVICFIYCINGFLT